LNSFHKKIIAKNFEQIKQGGINVIIKKLISFIYLMFQLPIYFFSIPLVVIIRLIRPWFLIRWDIIHSARIGEFAATTELYCCARDAEINIPSQKYIDLFCLKKKVCNKQLEKMWRRHLIILPRWLIIPIQRINRFLNVFASGGIYHEVSHLCHNMKRTLSSTQDVYNLLGQFQTHISFNEEEERRGKKLLSNFGLPVGAKFICFTIRDSAYLDRDKAKENYSSRNWKHQNFRDWDIDKFVLAAEELAERGYYIFRMGAKVLKPFKSKNPKIIDYANSKMRNDFMDIYLGAKCNFCISSDTGIDQIPRIFEKPIAYIYVPLGYPYATNKNNLLITKHHMYKTDKKTLNVSEIFSHNTALSFNGDEFELNNIELQENNQNEIRDLVIEMDERLNGKWNETNEDKILQKKFWAVFNKNIQKLNLKSPIHGKIMARFGAKFLRENLDFIE
jgi:putative glycosyltransferase (TIGR04372 family)